MKREFTEESFEHFLKRSADNLRMKAPDKVWQNLSKELNKTKRRTVYKSGTIFLIASILSYFVIANVELKKAPPQPVPQQPAVARISTKENNKTPKPTLIRSSQNFVSSTQAKPPRTNGLTATTPPMENSNIASNPLPLSEEGMLVAQNDFLPAIIDSYD